MIPFLLIVLAFVLPMPASAQCQVSPPPDKGKDNHHQATADQHPRLDPMEIAWSQCLAASLSGLTAKDVRTRIASKLQNQYPEHAAYDFYVEVCAMLQEDMGMPGKEAYAIAIRGGPGVETCLVDALINQAVEHSGGKLAFSGIWGGKGSLESQIAQVLAGRGRYVDMLPNLDGGSLSKEQSLGVRDLAQHMPDCLSSVLPVSKGSRKRLRRYEDALEDALRTTFSDRVVPAVRNKLRYAMRPTIEFSDQAPPSAYVERERALELQILQQVPGQYWEELDQYHRLMMTSPDEGRDKLDKEGCVLCRPSPEPEEKNDEDDEE